MNRIRVWQYLASAFLLLNGCKSHTPSDSDLLKASIQEIANSDKREAAISREQARRDQMASRVIGLSCDIDNLEKELNRYLSTEGFFTKFMKHLIPEPRPQYQFMKSTSFENFYPEESRSIRTALFGEGDMGPLFLTSKELASLGELENTSWFHSKDSFEVPTLRLACFKNRLVYVSQYWLGSASAFLSFLHELAESSDYQEKFFPAGDWKEGILQYTNLGDQIAIGFLRFKGEPQKPDSPSLRVQLYSKSFVEMLKTRLSEAEENFARYQSEKKITESKNQREETQ